MTTAPDSLTLDLQTEAEIRAALQANCEEWRGALTSTAYFEREALLANQDLTRDVGLRSWQLSSARPSSSSPSSDRTQLCACETLRKRALTTTSAGTVRPVQCQGVASVFTTPVHRRKAYAGSMIARLGAQLDAEPDCVFSVLYSDIGREFYARRGWRAMASAHLALEPDGDDEWPAGVRRLGVAHLEGLCARDESWVRRRLAGLAGDGRRAVAILADVQTLQWQLARERFVAQELLGRTPEVIGAFTTTEDGTDVWCWWNRWWYNTDPGAMKGNTMHILRLVVDSDTYDDRAAGQGEDVSTGIANAVGRLLAAARVEAAQWVMEDVQIWNPSETTLAAAKSIDSSVEVVHREKESIPSLRWCDAGDATGTEDILWIANEKFAWC